MARIPAHKLFKKRSHSRIRYNTKNTSLKDRYQRPMFWVTLAGVIVVALSTIVAGVGVYFTYSQVRLGEAQVKLAKRQLDDAAKAIIDARAGEADAKKNQERALAANEKFALAATIQAQASSFQAETAKGQLSTTQDTEERELRAYVGPMANESPTIVGGSFPVAWLKYQNTGNTPATVNSVNANFEMLKSSVFSTLNLNFRERIIGMHEALPAHGIHTASILMLNASIDNMQAFKNGNNIAVLHGIIKYEDVFLKRHQTTFCMWWTAQNKVETFCPTHNESD